MLGAAPVSFWGAQEEPPYRLEGNQNRGGDKMSKGKDKKNRPEMTWAELVWRILCIILRRPR